MSVTLSDKTIEQIKHAALRQFKMRPDGIHGLEHWERVYENGVYLSKYSGADLSVVKLFAYLHDCCRQNDIIDPDHGLRAARFAGSLGSEVLPISSAQLETLMFACEFHERGRTSDDPTIGTCWDSDRLDLGRVGVMPNAKFLSTMKARSPSVIQSAYHRSRS